MKYFITFEVRNRVGGFLGSGWESSEHTWICEEAGLADELAKVDRNGHRVIRIVKGEVVQFAQRTELCKS